MSDQKGMSSSFSPGSPGAGAGADAAPSLRFPDPRKLQEFTLICGFIRGDPVFLSSQVSISIDPVTMIWSPFLKCSTTVSACFPKMVISNQESVFRSPNPWELQIAVDATGVPLVVVLDSKSRPSRPSKLMELKSAIPSALESMHLGQTVFHDS